MPLWQGETVGEIINISQPLQQVESRANVVSEVQEQRERCQSVGDRVDN